MALNRWCHRLKTESRRYERAIPIAGYCGCDDEEMRISCLPRKRHDLVCLLVMDFAVAREGSFPIVGRERGGEDCRAERMELRSKADGVI